MDGLDKFFFDYITDKDRLRVRFKSKPNERPTFAVMLECSWIEDDWVQVARIDDWDGGPHIDRSYSDGRVVKTWLHDFMNNSANLKAAINQLAARYEEERSRYESGA